MTLTSGTLVFVDMNNPILNELGLDRLQIYKIEGTKAVFLTHRETVSIPLKKLKAAPLPYWRKNENGFLSAGSLLSNGTDVWRQAAKYGIREQHINSGDQVCSIHLIEGKQQIKIMYKSWKQKTVYLSFEELENVK